MSCFAQTSAVDRETLVEGGAQRVERSMTKVDEFREYAEETLRWSNQFCTEEEKKVLIDLAVTWMQAAWLSNTSVGTLSA
jgi:hypothetical protein